MKEFSQYIKKIVIEQLGSSFDVSGNTVNVYDQAPDQPSNNYIYQEILGFNNLGTQQDFVYEVSWMFVCVTKVNIKAQSTILLDGIVDNILQTFVTLNPEFEDAESNLKIFDATLENVSSNKIDVKGEVKLQRLVNIYFKCQQL